jgi:hypothetical protein
VERPKWIDFVYLAASVLASYWLMQQEHSDMPASVTMAHKLRKVARWIESSTTRYIDGELDQRRTV